MGIVIRNDDVNPNTDIFQLQTIYNIIKQAVPGVEIWTAFSMISADKSDPNHLYPAKDLPIKEQPIEYFYKNVGKVELPIKSVNYEKMVSHGLLHIDHKYMPFELQEMSIVTSCFLLKTMTFVPPFSEYDNNTESVCDKYGIKLVKRDGWKSLDYNDFNPDQKLWYFHSWRYTPEKLREKFAHACERLG
jgi:hypothetical protein